MDGLDKKDKNDKENHKEHAPAMSNAEKQEANKKEAKKQEDQVYAKLADKAEASGKPIPTATSTKKLSSGNFVTPTATPTHKPTSQPNALGKIPIVGGLLGGAGGGL